MDDTINGLMLQVKSDLIRHEGYKQYAYPDPLSKLAKLNQHMQWGDVPARPLMALIGKVNEDDGAPWTVGFGFTNGVTPDSVMPRLQAERKLEGLILDMNGVLYNYLSWYKDCTFVTKTVLINMGFNLGVGSLLKFKNSLSCIKAKLYPQAASNLRSSLWYKQVGARARELVERLQTQSILPQDLTKETNGKA